MKLRNRIFALILLCAMLACLAACGGKEGKSDTVYELKLDCVDPSTSIIATGLERFKAEVEEKSAGRIKINIFYGSTLGALADAYDNLLLGVSDMAWGAAAHYPGRFPCTEGMTIPYMGVDSPYHAAQAMWELYENDEQFQKEFKDVKLLALHTSAAFTLSSAKKDPSDIGGYPGLKIRTSSSNLTNWVTELGATPIGLSAGEVYEALSKNVVDMVVWDNGGLCNYKVYEQIKLVVDEPICYQPFFLMMNKKSYEKLPADLQAVIDECSGKALVDALAQDWQSFADTSRQTLIDEGVQMVALGDDARSAWHAAAENIQGSWIETLNGLGYDGQAVFDSYLAAIEKTR